MLRAQDDGVKNPLPFGDRSGIHIKGAFAKGSLFCRIRAFFAEAYRRAVKEGYYKLPPFKHGMREGFKMSNTKSQIKGVRTDVYAVRMRNAKSQIKGVRTDVYAGGF
jgi:hypothetical protein